MYAYVVLYTGIAMAISTVYTLVGINASSHRKCRVRVCVFVYVYAEGWSCKIYLYQLAAILYTAVSVRIA